MTLIQCCQWFMEDLDRRRRRKNKANSSLSLQLTFRASSEQRRMEPISRIRPPARKDRHEKKPTSTKVGLVKMILPILTLRLETATEPGGTIAPEIVYITTQKNRPQLMACVCGSGLLLAGQASL